MSLGVSVVIPARGPSGGLALCLETLTRQWPPDLPGEVIVVDDGSGADYGSTFVDLSTPVRLIRLPEQAGPAAARNEGVRRALNDWIAFTDDDCLIPWAWRTRLEEILSKDPLPRLIAGDIRSTQPTSWLAQATEDFVLTPVLEDGHWHVVTAHAIVHREAWLALGGFDERFRRAGGEDWDFSKRAAVHGLQIDFEPTLYLYHRNPVELRAFYERAKRYGSTSYLLREIHESPDPGHHGAELPPAVGIRRLSRAARRVVARSIDVAWKVLNLLLKPTFFARRYRQVRRIGVPRIRALRSVILYASFVAVYDVAYAREGRRARGLSTRQPEVGSGTWVSTN